MTKVQALLEELDHLSSDELELILSEIMRKMDKRKRILSILDDYVGKGKGVWGMDAQEYVNRLREKDRSLR